MPSLKFSAFGAYITSWQIDGREILYHGSELKRGGIPLLFPNFDAGDPLPYHGFGRVSSWLVVTESDNSFHLRLTDCDLTPNFREVYPYKFSADLKVEAIDNFLNYQLTVHNLDNKPLPVAPGLHPYWPVDHSHKSQIIISDFKIIDWNISPPNELHDFSGEFTVKFPNYQLIIKEIGSNHHFRGLQVWSQNSSFPDFNFVCFEPVTRPPNGLIDDPIIILPNQSTTFSLMFTYLPS